MRKLIIIGAILVVLIALLLLFASEKKRIYFILWQDMVVSEVKEGIKTTGYKDKSKEELKPIVREYVQESNKLRGIPLPRRYFILKTIAKMGKPGVEILIEILKDKEEGKNMVEFAYSGAGEINMRLATLYVIKEISGCAKVGNKNFKKAYETIREQIPAMVDVLLHDEDAEVRMTMAEILGEIGDNRAVEGLIKALDDPGEIDVGQVEPETVREAAARALGKMKDFRAVVPLIKALERERESSSTLSAIAYVLGEIGDRSAVRPMIELIKEGRLLKWKPWHRPDIVTDIGKLGGEEAVEFLLQELQDLNDRWERKYGINKFGMIAALGYTKDPRAIEPLRRILERTEDKVDRINIAVALANLGDKSAIKPLKELLKTVNKGTVLEDEIKEALKKLQ